MLQFIRTLVIVCLLKPFAKVFLGMDVYGRENIPIKGPAIVAANHNSHIDTVLLLCLFPVSNLYRVRPVAAADHFLKTPLSSWFSQNVIGVLPVERGFQRRDLDPLAGCKSALSDDEILLVFPEGTRGEAESMGRFKSGVARLAEEFPEAPVVPVYLQGAGRVLPRGAKVLVPFNCCAIVGRPFTWTGSRTAFTTKLHSAVVALRDKAPPLRWL